MFHYGNIEKYVTMSIKQWHEKLAQPKRLVRITMKKNNIKYIDDWKYIVCKGCNYGKQHRISHLGNFEIANTLSLQ